jgi:hypothetical protein
MSKISILRKAIKYARDYCDPHSQLYRPIILAYAAALTQDLKPTPEPTPPQPQKLVKSRIITNKLRCLKCNDIIESKYRRDFKMCSCESVFVDGGTDYMRRGGDLTLMEDLSEVEFFND